MLRFDRKQQNSVMQLSLNKIFFKKRSNIIKKFNKDSKNEKKKKNVGSTSRARIPLFQHSVLHFPFCPVFSMSQFSRSWTPSKMHSREGLFIGTTSDSAYAHPARVQSTQDTPPSSLNEPCKELVRI